jgi:hypothetical protein
MLEIENGDGKALTIRRAISGQVDHRLVTVFEGAALSKEEGLESPTDYYVRVPRSASSERGFHHRLAKFLSWELPLAPRFEGEDAPLYMETIFPLLSVEQKLGWGRVPARYPTWLGIRDVRRRTIEFVLAMDAYKIATERVAVQDEINRVRGSWNYLRTQAGKIIAAAGATVTGLPSDPISAWPPEPRPQVFIARNSNWEALPEHLKFIEESLNVVMNSAVPDAKSGDEPNREKLSTAEAKLTDNEMEIRRLLETLEAEAAEIEALQERITSLKEDQRKYKDLRRLRAFGSEDDIEIAHGSCPTCHQDLADSLLDLGKRATPMSVEQNISFYDEQLNLFSAVLENAQRAMGARDAQLQSKRSEIDELRNTVRSLRETLISPGDTPSIDVLATRLRLEQRLNILRTLTDQVDDITAEFAHLADEWKAVQLRRQGLPSGHLSANDEQKLRNLEVSFQKQLVAYRFNSVGANEVKISRDDYAPGMEDINLNADAAASDVIRLQWAYLLSLLRVGISSTSNHPGVLIMDEPQQQSVEDSAFIEMLKYSDAIDNCQVIIATSHDRNDIAASQSKFPRADLWELGDARLIGQISG